MCNTNGATSLFFSSTTSTVSICGVKDLLYSDNSILVNNFPINLDLKTTINGIRVNNITIHLSNIKSDEEEVKSGNENHTTS